MNATKRLSILHLRCQRRRHGCLALLARGFQFSLRCPLRWRACGGAAVDSDLSILYLRCDPTLRARCWPKKLSILYLRCHFFIACLIALSEFVSSFNSLFKMPVASTRDPTPWGRDSFNSLSEMPVGAGTHTLPIPESLSILYLRCRCRAS